jgi:hypothetical protein
LCVVENLTDEKDIPKKQYQNNFNSKFSFGVVKACFAWDQAQNNQK